MDKTNLEKEIVGTVNFIPIKTRPSASIVHVLLLYENGDIRTAILDSGVFFLEGSCTPCKTIVGWAPANGDFDLEIQRLRGIKT